jgi:hypothetical protein
MGDTLCSYRENNFENSFQLRTKQDPKVEATGNQMGVVKVVHGCYKSLWG